MLISVSNYGIMQNISFPLSSVLHTKERRKLIVGKKDTITKRFMRNKEVFADVFNYQLFDGVPVIQPDQLHELPEELDLVLDKTTKEFVALSKERDVLMSFTGMVDEEAVYLLLGIENQSLLHYAMPVRNLLYDAMQYDRQLQDIAEKHEQERRHQKRHDKHISDGEFIGKFYRNDKIIPVITIVVYFGAAPWDGPRSLHEMFATQDNEILQYVADYRINLISPADMRDSEIEKFQSSFREVMKFIKYSKDKENLQKIISEDERYQKVNQDAALVMNMVTTTKLKMVEEGKETIDMGDALTEIKEEGREEGLREVAKNLFRIGISIHDIAIGVQKDEETVTSWLTETI